MAKVDLAKEMQRLKALYAGMQDLELSELAKDADALTEIARQVLSEEMRRRSLEPPSPAQPNTSEEAKRQPIPPAPLMLRRYRDWPIAALAKTALDSAGIESFLVDENLVRIDWFYSNLIGGVKIFVRPEDVAEANRILDEEVPEETGGNSAADDGGNSGDAV